MIVASCHCGAVQFEVDAPEHIHAEECNCSICSKSGYLHLIVPLTKFDRSALKPHVSVLKEWLAKRKVVMSNQKKAKIGKNKATAKTWAKWRLEATEVKQFEKLIAEIEESPAL